MKRFYTHVTVISEPSPASSTTSAAHAGWRVMLDGRAIRTVGGHAQIVPSRPLAEALAAEWAAQGDVMDHTAFPLRDMADYALDIAGPDRAATIAALLPYAETDTLCYRAEPGTPFHARQLTVWEPLLIAAEQHYGVRFTRVSGIIHRPQPAATLARMHEQLAAADDFTLAALHSLASLAASLIIGLAALAPGADLPALWSAAQLEEEWQAELWGREAEAETRRTRRRTDFLAAARFATLAAQ